MILSKLWESVSFKEIVKSLNVRNSISILISLGFLNFLAKILYNIWTRKKQAKMFKHFPGYRGHWLFGVGPDFAKNIYRMHDWRIETMTPHKTFFFRLPLVPNGCYIHTIDSALVKHVLKDKFDIWTKHTADLELSSGLFKVWLGDGIFTQPHGSTSPDKGAAWTYARKIASGIFTKVNLGDTMRKTFAEHAKIFVEILEKNGEKEIDIQQKFFAYTMDTTITLFFGRESHTLSGTFDPIAYHFDRSHRGFVKLLRKNYVIFALADLLPWPFGPLRPGRSTGHLSTIIRYLLKDGRDFNKSTSFISKSIDSLIEEKMKDPNLKNQRDLVALFLNSTDENGETYAQKKHLKFLRDTAVSFMFAGRDTTAGTLSWLFYILSTHPEIQEKLCEEIDRVLKGKDDISAEDVTPTSMPYLNGIVYETLRLYPPVPEDGKIAGADDTFPDGTKVPKGTTLFFFPYGMGRDPDRYDEPLKVKPERWIPFIKPSDYDFPVFQAGPRICLGVTMALLEVKILTATVLQKFTFTMDENEAKKITGALLASMSVSNDPENESYNLWVTPHKRSPKKSQ